MSAAEEVRKRSAQLRWRQGTTNIVLSVLLAWAFPRWDPDFLVLGLFPFAVLRLVQGTELWLGLARGGWTDIPMTPPVIGCWATAAVYLQRLMAHPGALNAAWFGFWIAAGLALYTVGRWMQQRYYRRRQAEAAPPRDA